MRVVRLMVVAAILAAWGVFRAAAAEAASERGGIDEWLMNYHRQPVPDSIAELIRSLDREPQLTGKTLLPLGGFFYEVFRANPDRVPEWRKLADELKNPALKQLLLDFMPEDSPETVDERARSMAETVPDFAWGAYFSSGKSEYPQMVLRLALSQPDRGSIDPMAAAAHWSLLSVSRRIPEVEAILREYFQRAPEPTLRNFFRFVDVADRQRFLNMVQLAKLPPPEKPRDANPFAGIYSDWTNRKTSDESTKELLAGYEEMLRDESPGSDPEAIHRFFEYFYVGNLPELSPEEVETVPAADHWAEAERITRLFRSNQGNAARKAEERLLAGVEEFPIARVVLLEFARNSWKKDTPQYDRYNEQMISQIERNVLAGKWKGRICYQWFYNLLSLNSSCGSRYWGRLEAKLKLHADRIDPWFREMIQGRAAVGWAWESRGGGLASTVSEEGWKGFRENLDKARNHFHAALKLHPDWINPYTQLITVEMGASDREAMIEAFKKLIQSDPENVSGFEKLLWGLLPRWGGSHHLIRQLAVEAMSCPRRDVGVPAMGYQCLAEIAWDYPGMGWQNVYLDPEIRRLSDQLFAEYEKRAETPAARTRFLAKRFVRELAELRYDDAAATLREYGGAEKYAAKGYWQRSRYFEGGIGTPGYDDPLMRLKLFTGNFAAPLREIERRFLAGEFEAENFRRLREIIGDPALSQEEREFLIDFHARWRLNCSPQEYCGDKGKILSAFAVAGKFDRQDVAMEMIELGYRYRENENYPGESAYNIAREGKDPALLKILQTAGDPLDRRDPELGYAPIHIAARMGNAPMVAALLDLGIPVELKNRNGHTALHIAATEKVESVIRLLLERGADPNLGDNDGDVCLMYLPQVRAPLRIYRIFAEHPGVDLNRPNRGGDTPLHFMARAGTPVEIVRFLVGRGMKTDLRNNAGKTPLDLAEENGNRTLAHYLAGIGAKHGADLPPPVAPVRAAAEEAELPSGFLRAEYCYGLAAIVLLTALGMLVWKRRKNSVDNE